MNSELDIGDVEKEPSEISSETKSEGGGSSDSSKSKKSKKSGSDSDSDISDYEYPSEEDEEKEEKEEEKSEEENLKEIKLKKKDGGVSKKESEKADSQGKEKEKDKEENKDKDKDKDRDKDKDKDKDKNEIIDLNESSIFSKKETKNRFFIPQYNQRLETLMNIQTEDYTSGKEEESSINKEDEKIKKEKEVIKKEKKLRKLKRVDDTRFHIAGTQKDLYQFMKKEEMLLQKEKIKFLEEKNLKLDKLNQMYYDIIKESNLDIIKNNINNNNSSMKLQSLDGLNNNNPNFQNNFYHQNQENLDFAIKNYIDGERNKNIHNFNDSMLDINQKITNYLIDSCLNQKDKNQRLEDLIGEKLDRIEKNQKKQKHDIDFIIKYGLNKNRALDPIVGVLYDYQRPLPKLLKEIDEENKYDKILNRNNYIPLKNFYLKGRYSNVEQEKRNTDLNNRNSGILRKTGSCIFENRKNPFNYKLKENGIYNKNNPYIKRPFFKNMKKNIEIKNKKSNMDDIYDDEEYQKFIAYKGKYFIPADFRFGGVKGKKEKYIKPKRYKTKNEIDFII